MSKKMKLAISAEDDLFQLGRILDKRWAKKYPGASWLPLLYDYLKSDFEIVTADVALDHVTQGFWKSADMIVIQHGDDAIAHQLIEKGAFPLALTCFESPLYINDFYHKISTIATRFKYRILFSGLHELYNADSGVNYHTTFPSYFLADLDMNMVSWENRKFMVAVIGNKYVIPMCCPKSYLPTEWLWWFKKIIAKFLYQSTSSGKYNTTKLQLQDYRLKLISYFLQKNVLDLFGKGWGTLRNLPPRWQSILKPSLTKYPAKQCENKLDTIQEYKFGLCIENAQFPGYITEKIIDCFVAGVIPLYMGAPDIDKYIPKSCFVDLRDYNNIDELMEYLQSMSDNDASEIITCGQQFLLSDKGRLYSYEGFAEFMASIVRAESKVIV